MNIVLPTAAALAKANINGTELSKTPSSTLVSLAAGQGREVALVGRLVWNDRDLGWATQWQIDRPGRPHRSRLRGVTFDESFRRGIGGAAQVLSDNGEAGSLNLKPQQRDLTPALRRPVEPAAPKRTLNAHRLK
jgi:uncharacterized protein